MIRVQLSQAVDRSRLGGFTLMELLVALFLASLLTLGIMAVSRMAQEIYSETTKKVDLANRFRLALLTVDRDFSQWINTSNLEFFNDGKGAGAKKNSHWDEGEQLRDTADALGPGVVDGGSRQGLQGYDEFATIIQRHYRGLEPGFDPGDDENYKIHSAYQAYFRTMTFIDGKLREANVEYMLVDPTNLDGNGNPLPPERVVGADLANLTLVKIVRYHRIDSDEVYQKSRNLSIVRRRVEVASNVTDFKIEYASENRFNNRFGFRWVTPREDFEKPAERATKPERFSAGPLDAYRKTFGYGSNHVARSTLWPRAIAYKGGNGDRQQQTLHDPVRFGFGNNADIHFAELVQGDEIYCYTEGSRAAGASGGTGLFGSRPVKFLSDNYTVKANLSGRLEFYEDILAATWDGDQGPLLYKASYLPQALRITLRVVDDDGINPKTLQRVVWIRRKSR